MPIGDLLAESTRFDPLPMSDGRPATESGHKPPSPVQDPRHARLSRARRFGLSA